MTVTPDESGARLPLSGYQTDTVAKDVQTAPDGTPARVAGRLVLWRRMGGLVFGHIQDLSGRVQISLARNDLGEETFKAWLGSAPLVELVSPPISTLRICRAAP